MVEAGGEGHGYRDLTNGLSSAFPLFAHAKTY